MAVTEGSRRGKGVRIGGGNVGKYVRYTEKQIEALHRVYAECPNPNRFQLAEIICDEPALRGLDNKQLKIWFQNRRSREKQKKESDDIMLENRRLTAANNLLRQQNDDLQEQVTQLTNENEHLRNQILDLPSHITTFDLDHLLEEHHPEMGSKAADNNSSLFSLAAEIRKEFLSKAIGTAINWTLAPGLKLDSVGVCDTVYIPSTCDGVAARACASITFDPFKASSIPVVVRPIYESSELLGKKTIVSALLYIEHMANETSGIPRHSCYEDPELLRCFCRGFNDTVNCFSEDGWTLMNANSSDGILMSAKRTANFGVYANCDSILCLKASLQLQNVFPASLVKLLAECRAARMGFNFNDRMVASRLAPFAFPGIDISRVSAFSALFGQTNNKDEMINAMADNGFGACSELIFAPIDATILILWISDLLVGF